MSKKKKLPIKIIYVEVATLPTTATQESITTHSSFDLLFLLFLLCSSTKKSAKQSGKISLSHSLDSVSFMPLISVLLKIILEHL